jgi:hypothetical protein
MTEANAFKDAFAWYIDTSDRPYDNRTGAFEALSDFRAVQLGAMEALASSPADTALVGRFGSYGEIAIGATRIGIPGLLIAA